MSINKEHQVNQLLSLALSHGIDIDPTDLTVNESGLDFLAVFVKTKQGVPWVLRAPRRSDVIESAQYEKKVLDLLEKYFPLEAPKWQVHMSDLIAYPMLEGVPIATINAEGNNYDWYLDSKSLPELFIQSLAEAMAALHGINQRAAASAGIRVKQPSEVRQDLLKKMQEIKKAFGVSQALWERWNLWLADDSFWPNHSALVHGDLHPGHILVTPQGRVTGLLDWTEAEIADPAADFTIYYALFGESWLSDLLVRYEKAGGRIWPRMFHHIVEMKAAYPLNIALFAMKSGLEEYMTMARVNLGVDEHGEELPMED